MHGSLYRVIKVSKRALKVLSQNEWYTGLQNSVLDLYLNIFTRHSKFQISYAVAIDSL